MKRLLIGLALLISMPSFAMTMESVIKGFSDFSSINGITYTAYDNKPDGEGLKMLVTGDTAEIIWSAALNNGVKPTTWRRTGKVTLNYKGWKCKQLDLGVDTQYDLVRIFHSEVDGNIACAKMLL